MSDELDLDGRLDYEPLSSRAVVVVDKDKYERMRGVLEAIAYHDERTFILEHKLLPLIDITLRYETIVNQLAAWALEGDA